MRPLRMYSAEQMQESLRVNAALPVRTEQMAEMELTAKTVLRVLPVRQALKESRELPAGMELMDVTGQTERRELRDRRVKTAEMESTVRMQQCLTPLCMMHRV